MMRTIGFMIFMLGCLLVGVDVQAQNVAQDVFVTTQDYSSLRTGPGLRFERVAIVPPATTVRAIGRSADMRWVQVEFGEQPGWIASWLLVWSGDIISLPVDGAFEQDPFIRRMVVAGLTRRDAPIYRRQLVASDQVGTIPVDTEVEITGRLGDQNAGYYWLQIRWDEQQYWIGSWDVDITFGSIDDVLDTTYLYPYGRLVTRLDIDSGRSLSSLLTIENIWVRLGEAQPVSCEDLPEYVERSAVDSDIEREPIFDPVASALDTAIIEINTAISTFDDACARIGETQLTQQDVRRALNGLNSARRNLTLAAALLNSLGIRNPLLDSALNNQPVE